MNLLQSLHDEAQALSEQLVTWRRDFHRHPELGFQEVRTAGIVADHLAALGLEVSTGIGKTGVVAIVEGEAVAPDAPTVMLRFDMDALPINEQTGLPFSSQPPNVMHACGHDGHTAIGMGVANLLVKHRQQLPGRVKLVFQPAEEGPGGADPMIKEGVLLDPKVDMALGLHLWSPLPVGKVALSAGPVMAAADTFSIKIMGKGGHAAAPESCIDTVLIAAQMITNLHTLTGRYVDPFEPSVLSVTRIHAGSADNVIPGEAEIGGTVRTVHPATREHLRVRMHEMVHGIAKGYGAHVQFEYREGYPPLINDDKVTQMVRKVCTSVLNHAPDLVVPQRTMGGEDMAYFLREVPGCYFFLGSGNDATGCSFAHHHPRFNVDEDALLLGVEMFLRLVDECGAPTP